MKKDADICSLMHTEWRYQYHVVFAPKYWRMERYGAIKQDIGAILWNNRDIPKLQSQGSCFVTFISSIHQQMNRRVNRTELPQESSAFRSVAAVSSRQCKRYPIPIRCGDHMKFGIPSSSCSPNGLWPTFFKAPIPSG